MPFVRGAANIRTSTNPKPGRESSSGSIMAGLRRASILAKFVMTDICEAVYGYGYGYGFKLGLYRSPTSLPKRFVCLCAPVTGSCEFFL